MKPLPAPHAATMAPLQAGLLRGVGLSLAAHMAIGALIIGVSHKTETAAVPIVAIELFDSREEQAMAPHGEGAPEQGVESPAEPAATSDAPSPSADPDLIAPGFSSIDTAQAPLLDAGSAPPATAPSNPSLPVTPQFSMASEPTPSEQPLAEPIRIPDETKELASELPTMQSAMDAPPPPTRQPPPRKPPAPVSFPVVHPKSFKGPTAERESVAGQPPAQSGTEHSVTPTGLRPPEAESGDRSAHPLISPPPRYPAAARRRGQQGRVVLRVLVSASGVPEDVQLVESSGTAALDDAATDAVRQWRFHPALRNGAAVGTRLDVPIRFRLEED